MKEKEKTLKEVCEHLVSMVEWEFRGGSMSVFDLKEAIREFAKVYKEEMKTRNICCKSDD